jgi:GNAT superfamily N-acetyltransferase
VVPTSGSRPELTMKTRFAPVAFAEIRSAVRRHLASLPAAIDSFLEDHIVAATHYRILIGDEPAGFASIHDGTLITQFALTEPYRHLGQPLFTQLRTLEQVQSAFVPTCDEFYLSHALDDYRHLAKQAYFFATADHASLPATSPHSLRPAEPNDAGFILQEAGDFLPHTEEHIAKQELFVTLRGDEPAGIGISVRSTLYDNVASIGMYTFERFRQQGVATATISLLIEECRRNGLRPIAGCWYYNHLSKRTLERAGMYSPTRLLKIDY